MMQGAEKRVYRVQLARQELRWVAEQIAKFETDSSWVEGKGKIKNALPQFTILFWWTIVRNHLSLTSMDNMFTWARVVLLSILIAAYDIDFARWIRDETHYREFCEFTIVLFPYLV